MKELFIPYTEALELQKLGFDEKCFGSYKIKTYSVFKEGEFYMNSPTDKNSINAPLYSQAFKWFRDKYDLSGDIISQHKNMYFTTILNLNTDKKQDVKNKKIIVLNHMKKLN